MRPRGWVWLGTRYSTLRLPTQPHYPGYTPLPADVAAPAGTAVRGLKNMPWGSNPSLNSLGDHISGILGL